MSIPETTFRRQNLKDIQLRMIHAVINSATLSFRHGGRITHPKPAARDRGNDLDDGCEGESRGWCALYVWLESRTVISLGNIDRSD